ncbi:MAG: S41 family peptidase [Pirellulaceae bacterium]|nr:S41 family peptidase [Pirellulaceae bacterium]
MKNSVRLAVIFSLLTICSQVFAQPTGRPIKLANHPALSPDGGQLVFSWNDEIWLSAIDGTGLTRLTNHPAADSQPLFSPDGKQIAFVSTRTGSPQIFVMQADGTLPKQVTFHTAGYSLADWFPDGKSLLAVGARDHFYRDAERLIQIDLSERKAEKVLVNAAVKNPKLSPNGKRVLFNREGERWWRKGYTGERSAQVWHYDLDSGEFKELLHEGVECMWPLWMANGKGFYFVKGDVHGFDLWRYRFPKNAEKPATQKQIAGFDEDSIVFPAISRDGKTIVFRHLFDLYRFRPDEDKLPIKIELTLKNDADMPDDVLRRKFAKADEVVFTDDGLEIALIAGGDVWVMDTKLKEPQRVTKTDGYEANVTFAPDGKSLWFTSVSDGQTDVWKATRADADKFWWQNAKFTVEKLTDDMHVESGLRFTPDAKHLIMQQGRGDLVAMNIESRAKRTLVEGFSGLDFDISPDSRWLAYAKQDNDFNSEIWLARLEGDVKPTNVSRHPDNDDSPRFSPDGKMLAFTGRRFDDEVDIYYVYLREADNDQTSRERQIEEALELMKKKRKTDTPKAVTESKESKGEVKPDAKADPAAPAKDEPKDKKDEKKDDKKGESGDDKKKEVKPIAIDLENIHERLRRISISNSSERGLLFSPDGKKLAFAANVDGKSGWYTIEFPSELQPKLLSSTTGSNAVWTDAAGGILFNQDGRPAKLDPSGKLESYGFNVAQESSRSGWLRAGFYQAWLTMREVWYDPRMGNRNWDEISRKYAQVAGDLQTVEGLATVVELMLGELNGSHLGFTPEFGPREPATEGWRDETAHLGVRFVEDHRGPGLLVRDVIPDSPADREQSKLKAGDVILSIDGKAVDPAMDLTTVLNGPLDRDILLHIERTTKGEGDKEEKKEIDISLRPIVYATARSLLYDHWLEHNRQAVDKASGGKLGYLHIRAMDMGSFYEFERQLYNVGYGREGLVIDVRDNGGGSTTDLLLTALTQPKHAITVPRGGGPGYPHDRIVFASWSKPIIVLCNQNSYSNAEIFSHAIKTLGRGKVVGVQTAGGVVSTGSAMINDVGRLRVPFRGWFLLNDGQDMELNGCLPDEVIWPAPKELPAGQDRQLDKAVEMLMQEISNAPAPKTLRYATEK